ncbi:MAG TPA: hypothetical protein VNN19_13120 [bacterium]|nr:hypothetical protein [bacterium]
MVAPRALAVLLLQQPPPPPDGSVPGLSDTAAVVIGTVLSLLVLYAIVAANWRQWSGR